MKCPDCGKNNTMVVETRMNDEKTIIKRRRKCEDCESKFNTLEKLDSVELMVRKRDKTKEPFNKEKIVKGMKLALKKRPFDGSLVEDLANRVEDGVLERGGRVVNTKEIGEIVMEVLKGVDKVAYLRFASVCHDFDDVDSFEKELETLKIKN